MAEETVGESLGTGEEAAAAAAAEKAAAEAAQTPEQKAAAEVAAAEKAAADAAAQTPEQKAAAEKVAEEKAAGDEKAGAPEAYTDFTLPEGMELDTVAMEAAVPIFKELNLTQDQAQKLVALQTAQLTATAEAQQAQWEKTNDDWREEAKGDPEFGKANLQASLGHVKTFLDKFATTEFRQMLDDTGMGNRLEVLRMFATVGKAMGEDTVKTGLANITGKKPAHELLYGGTTSV